jgi:hypothetical protein
LEVFDEIGVKEQAGVVPFFDSLLADTFLFRRADGTIVDKRRYLDDLTSVAKNPYERLDTVVENVMLDGDGDSGVVNVLVLAKRKNMERAAVFQNVRVFSRQGENWKLIARRSCRLFTDLCIER